MKEKLLMYSKIFGENFPIMMLMGESEEKIIGIIDECIAKQEPYKADDDDPKENY